jgi:hypothetical protein
LLLDRSLRHASDTAKGAYPADSGAEPPTPAIASDGELEQPENPPVTPHVQQQKPGANSPPPTPPMQPTSPLRVIMNGGRLDIQASVDLEGLKKPRTMLEKYQGILEMMQPADDEAAN